MLSCFYSHLLSTGRPISSLFQEYSYSFRYRETDENSELVRWFWEVLESFSNDERILFMRFVSGRSRLPANPADITQRFQIMKVDRVSHVIGKFFVFNVTFNGLGDIGTLAMTLKSNSLNITYCYSVDVFSYLLYCQMFMHFWWSSLSGYIYIMYISW